MNSIPVDPNTSLILALIKMAQADGTVSHFEQMNITMLSNTLGVDRGVIATLKKDLDNMLIVRPELMSKKRLMMRWLDWMNLNV